MNALEERGITVVPKGFGHTRIGEEKQITGCDCFSEPI
jgi:hypothetical protein